MKSGCSPPLSGLALLPIEWIGFASTGHGATAGTMRAGDLLLGVKHQGSLDSDSDFDAPWAKMVHGLQHGEVAIG